MPAGLFELFKIGIGPSSSHTVGPMVAARRYLADIDAAGKMEAITGISVELYGSLALTGKGHGTDKAILLGLEGEQPEAVDPDIANGIVDRIKTGGHMNLLGRHPIPFDVNKDLCWHSRERLPHHPNGMRFIIHTPDPDARWSKVYYSVGGGFVLDETQIATESPGDAGRENVVPYPFQSARELLEMCKGSDKRISDIVLANEVTLRSTEDIYAGIDSIWETMRHCIERGCRASGLLPGRLKVTRRAGNLYQQLVNQQAAEADPMQAMDWVNLWAIAVNEENAAGGRVVTAPTNGAAGIIPAVVNYYLHYYPKADQTGIHTFFLTATAIGALYKQNASISGAEVGCQGEVGVACSMAAAGLAAATGGSNEQVETAAEIGMEHNLGLTCDPIGGLVQIPCIERNAMGAIKAINACRMAIAGDGNHKVSLDRVIETMRQTGMDMQDKYKETSKGGLAINVVEC